MSFKSSFLHTIISQSIFEDEEKKHAYLPKEQVYSTEATEHIIYLKAILDTTFPANAHYTQSNYHSYLLIYTISGNANLTLQNNQYPIVPGSVCFIDCRQEYTLRCSTPWSFQALFIDGYPIPYYYDRYHENNLPVTTLSNNSLIPGLFTKLVTSKYNHKEIIQAELLTRILTQLLITHCDTLPNPNIPEWIQQLKNVIETDYTKHFTLDELADQFHINKFQICRDFKKYLKTSPLQYLNHVRLEHAKELLSSSTLHVNEISWQIGFENTNHFIQLFKKEFGMTPTMYRKKEY